MHHASRWMKISAACFFLAILVSLYLVSHHYALQNGLIGAQSGGPASFCSINSTVDCDVVNSSKYAKIGGIPLAEMGLAYSLLGFILTFWASIRVYRLRDLTRFILPLVSIGVVFALGALLIASIVLHKICLLCSALQILVFCGAATAWVASRKIPGPSAPSSQRSLLLVVFSSLALLLCTHWIAAGLLEQHLPLDETQFLNEYRSQTPISIPKGQSKARGNTSNPTLTIVAFSDIQCPFCAIADQKMRHPLQLYSDRIQFIFKHYPLDSACNARMTNRMHPFACLGAQAVFCAQKQDKLETYLTEVFLHQSTLSNDTFSQLANQHHLDRIAFEACLQSAESRLAVAEDIAAAEQAGVSSTPTFFVNGRKIEGILDERRIELLLREATQ